MRTATLVVGYLTLAWMLSGAGCAFEIDQISISNTVPDGRVGVEFFFAIETNDDVNAFRIVAGELPPGLQLSNAGELFGVPTMTGTFSFTVEALDVSQGFIEESTSKAFSLTIRE